MRIHTIFMYPDGRLKVGRLTAGVFVLLMTVMGILFHLKSTMDEASVTVKHIFEPKPMAQVNPDNAGKSVPETMQAAMPEKKPVSPLSDNTKKMDEKPSGDMKTADETKAPPVEDIQKPLATPQKAEARPDEKKKDSPKKEAETVQKDDPKIDGKQEHPEKRPTAEKKLEEPSEDRKITVTDKSGMSETEIKPSPAKKTVDMFTKNSGGKERSDDAAAVTVDDAEYSAILKNWLKSETPDDAVKNIPLEVENLRASYDLFQMKPVAVVKTKYYDLEDGAPISEQSLESYSSIVFVVDKPWDKFEDKLIACGIRKEDAVEVRYYMYDFIRNAIYSRVNRAVDCIKETEKGLNELPVDKFHVLGRAYVIGKESGGRFGVFIPVSASVQGRQYAVGPGCFRDQEDVRTLVANGAL